MHSRKKGLAMGRMEERAPELGDLDHALLEPDLLRSLKVGDLGRIPEGERLFKPGRRARRRRRIRRLMSLALLICLGVTAWYWLNAPSGDDGAADAKGLGSEQDEVSLAAVEELAPKAGRVLPAPGKGVSGSLPGRVSVPGSDTEGSRARALVAEYRASSESNPDSVYDTAERFQEEGLLGDAYLLYYFAASEGHAPAALKLGNMYDPAYAEVGETLLGRPDPVQAFKWYSLADELGSPVATEHLSALKASIEEAAAAGDVNAHRLTLMWK